MNIDYAVCQALNTDDVKGLPRVLLIYDIMCNWWRNFEKRVNHSPYLSLPEGVDLMKGIGDFHVRGHVPECFPRFGLIFIEGTGIVDGEIVETLWSVLNETSRSSRAATLAHRSEILDDHMNHSNWKKTIAIGAP
jgi:Kyakuja-Dileera-Zisupton transposase